MYYELNKITKFQKNYEFINKAISVIKFHSINQSKSLRIKFLKDSKN